MLTQQPPKHTEPPLPCGRRCCVHREEEQPGHVQICTDATERKRRPEEIYIWCWKSCWFFFSFSWRLRYQLSRLMDALTGVWPVLLVYSLLVLDRYRILYLSPKGSSVSTVHHYILYSSLRQTEEAQYMAYGEERAHFCFFCCPVPMETSMGKDKSIRSAILDQAYTRHLKKKKSVEIK